MSRISEALREEIERDKQGMTSKGTTPFWKVPTNEGEKHRVRVLPGTFGKSGERWYMPSNQHWANKKPYECPALAHKGDCPFCEKVEELRKHEATIKAKLKSTGDDKAHKRLEKQATKLSEMIKALLPRQQFMVNLLDRSEETPMPRVYRVPKSVFSNILDAWETEDYDIFDPKEGNDIRISKMKSGQRTDYKMTVVTSRTPIAESSEERKAILEKVNNLEDLVSYTDEDTMREAVNEVAADIEDALEESGTVTKKPRVSADDDDDDAKPKKKKVVDDDDDDPPKKKKTSTDDDDDAAPKKKKVVDDDDDDPPKKKKSADDDDEKESDKLRGKLGKIVNLGDDDDDD